MGTLSPSEEDFVESRVFLLFMGCFCLWSKTLEWLYSFPFSVIPFFCYIGNICYFGNFVTERFE